MEHKSDDGPAKDAKSKRYVYVATGSLLCAVLFLVATGMLANQVGIANEHISRLEQKLKENQATSVAANVSAGTTIPPTSARTTMPTTLPSTTICTTPSTPKMDEPVTEKSIPVCTSKTCVAAAGHLIDAMDESVDPCQDFYQFACGAWMQNNPIPHARNDWQQFSIVRDRVTNVLKGIVNTPSTSVDSQAINKTREVFQTCLNTTRIEELGLTPLTQVLATFGHWPMTIDSRSSLDSQPLNWSMVSASLNRNFSGNYLFEVFNYADIFDDPDRSVIYIDQPSVIIPQWVWTNSTAPSSIAFLDAYGLFAIDVAKAIRDQLKSKVSDSRIARDVQHMVDFEMKLGAILNPESNYRGRWEDATNKTYRLDQLQELSDRVHPQLIDWSFYLQHIYSDVELSSDEPIYVMEPKYVEDVISLLSQTNPRVVVNYLLWRLVVKLIPETTNQLFGYLKEFQQTAYGAPVLVQRWRQCLANIDEPLGFALSAEMVRKTFSVDAKSDIEKMIQQLKIAFASLVDEADWIDVETKTSVKAKAGAMTHLIAYPDWIQDDSLVDTFYDGFQVSESSHLENVVKLLDFVGRNERSGLRLRTDRSTWITYPHVVNAFYAGLYNSISFPAGILQPPFYGKGRPAALNYGAIGAVIGHEITHGFDNNGRKRDKLGQIRPWWTNDSVVQFSQRADCFVQQYSNFTVPELVGTDLTHLNGTKTLGENIADNGGLREAFRAYQTYIVHNGPEPRLPGLEKYSNEQLFFISWAHTWCNNPTPESLRSRILYGVHSPPRYRVLGTLTNSEEFARHFHCDPDTPMNPPNKCVLW